MISVIIPLYNKEPIIEKCLNSVLSQDYDDFEVVIVNDGSTDRSSDVVKSYTDYRIRLIEQKNGGPSKARNTGILASKGEWLYFIDADDEIEPGALKHFHDLAVVHPEADMFLGEVSFWNGKSKIASKVYEDGYVKNIFKSHFLDKTFQCSGSSLYKRSVCEKFLYNENIRRFEDLECLFRRYRECSLYLTHFPVAVINVEYAAASHGRRDIKEDFLGYLDFKGKSFWEKMCLYQLYLAERPHYMEQCRALYPGLDKRFDLLILSKILKR